MHEGLATCPTERERERERTSNTERERQSGDRCRLRSIYAKCKTWLSPKQKHRAHFYYKYKTIFVVKKYIRKAKKLSFCRRGNMHMTIAGNLCAAKWLQNMVQGPYRNGQTVPSNAANWTSCGCCGRSSPHTARGAQWGRKRRKSLICREKL